MGTTTTTFGLNKPTVGGDDNAWGGDWNQNADKLDDLLDGTTAIKPNLSEGLWKVGGTVITATSTDLNNIDAKVARTAATGSAVLPAGTTDQRTGLLNRAIGTDLTGNSTYWVDTATSNGITITKTASGTDVDGLPYADYTVAGTASALSEIEPYASAAYSRAAATSAQVFTTSFVNKITAGTTPSSPSGIRVDTVGETAPSTYVDKTSSSVSQATTDTVLSAAHTVSGSVNQVRGTIVIVTASGAVVNYTVRLKALQLELGSSRTTYQSGTPQTGYFRFNSTIGAFEGYNGSAWGSVGGATGAADDRVFYENGQTVTTSYTISASRNAMSAGPITVNSGVTVTVGAGQRWVVI
jgi:hypothetical protein